jgi:hypothetical protein
MGELHFEWVIPQGDCKLARELLLERGAHFQSLTDWEPNEKELEDAADAGADPKMVLAVSISAVILLKTISGVVLEQRYPGGNFFDVRAETVKTYPIPSARKGMIVVQTKDGTEYFEASERADGLQYLSDAIEEIGA